MIFQEYVPAAADLRVTVVGETVFAAAIDSSDTDYPVDFRMSLGQARVEPTDCPPTWSTACSRSWPASVSSMAPSTCVARPDGEHVFLEVNTAGEFLFVEERTGQPITEAIAGWLADPARESAVVSGRAAR